MTTQDMQAQRFSEEAARQVSAAQVHYGDVVVRAKAIIDRYERYCSDRGISPEDVFLDPPRQIMSHETGHLGEIIDRMDADEAQRQAQQRITFRRGEEVVGCV